MAKKGKSRARRELLGDAVALDAAQASAAADVAADPPEVGVKGKATPPKPKPRPVLPGGRTSLSCRLLQDQLTG